MEVSLSIILKMNPSERAAVLTEAGFSDGRLASQNIEDLQRFSYLSGELPHVIEAALNSPDPDSALNFLERFCTAADEAGIDIKPLQKHLPLFIKIFGSSEFLSSILIRKPERCLELITSPYLKKEKPLSAMKLELGGVMAGISDYNGLLTALRLYKQRDILRIGAKDLLGFAPLEEVTAELSSLASASLDTAYRFCLESLKEEYGTPYCRGGDGNPRECSFVVLGMGKLGGNELNFSSDIDLIYLYESDEGELDVAKSHSIYEFYCKLAELLTKALSSNTEEGFVFRVDLRLRPDGQNGPIVNSLINTETYYESWGDTWERSAMLKARPVAGDTALGERFLNEIGPFIYRKYLDFSTVEDIKEMKQKIDRELSLKPGMWDVKLGSGGIREIEFLVQATQLIHAGKEREIREKNTLKSLQRLREKGLLSDNDHEALTSAYRFLRTVEHRIQIENERQTHRLPSKEDDFKKLARRCGFKDAEGLRNALELHSRNVERLFDGIFHEPSKRLEEIPAEISSLFAGALEGEEAVNKLRSLGFEEPGTAGLTLQTLREGGGTRLSRRSKTALRKLAPHLFLKVSRSPDPDMSLANLDRFLNAVGAKGSFYSLLIENPKMVRFLATLFGTSDFLSQFLIGHPELLDTLLRSDTMTPVKGKEELREELMSVLNAADGYEEVLDAIRRFRNAELIRIGINDIAEEIGLMEVCGQMSSLAELSIDVALQVSGKELISRYGAPSLADGSEAAISVIGMGKLGGGEMNYSSDLDLIFIYSGAGETKGPRVITNQEYFAKVAQRVISFLTLQTREGYLYKVDTRLRPSGSAGALVSSLDSFRRYHEESARLWERQSLIKARAVSGSPELGARVMDDIGSIVYGRGVDEEGREEMASLRERMEKELAKERPEIYNVKTGRGGIVDIEFTVQFLQLKYGKGLTGLRKFKTPDTLQSLSEAGLITSEDGMALKDAYAFLMKTENRLRVVHNISTDQMELEPLKLVKLAKRLGYSGDDPGGQFLRDYHRHTEKVREIYNRIVVRGQ